VLDRELARICRQRRQLLYLLSGIALLDDEVLSLDVPELP
jgi:hypothetical protein